MNRRYKTIGEHPCKVGTPADDPNDCWPCLTPRANIFQRTIRALRRYTLPCFIHPQTKYVYKSITSFRAEKSRMIYHTNPLIMHPYSMLAMIRLVTLFFFMLFYFIIHTYRMYFRLYNWIALEVLLKIPQAIFIITQFMVGYVEQNDEQMNIILNPKMIFLWNLKRYVLVDIMEFFRIYFLFIPNQTTLLCFNFIMYHAFLFGVVHRFFISKHDKVGALIQCLFGLNHLTLDFVSFLSFIAICVHYLTCFRFGMPKLIALMDGRELSKLQKYSSKYVEYITYMNNVLASMYKANTFFDRDYDEFYEPVECLTRVCTFVLHIYILVYVLIAARNTNKSKFKYSIMWNNVQNFLKNRKISGKLKYKILAHYQHKFQFKFFEESYIIESLSKHLQYECQLHTCGHFIVNTSLLRGLPRVTVGRIVAAFKPIVYLPNDVILQWQGNFDGIFIISYGTVAVYLDTGKEVMHLEDGGVIGATGYYMGTNFFTATAVTFTEMYKLEAFDLERVTKISPELSVRLKQVGRNRIMMVQRMYTDGLQMNQMIRFLKQEGRKLRYEEEEEDEIYTKNV